jgi:hypothetical protein
VCAHQPLWHLLIFVSCSSFFTYEGSENTEEDPDDPEPANEGDIQMEYFSD